MEGIVESVDDSFARSKVFSQSAETFDDPEAKCERNKAYARATEEVRARITMCLCRRELRQGQQHMLTTIDTLATRFQDLKLRKSQLTENETRIMVRTHQRLMCLRLVSALTQELLLGQYERSY